MPIYDYECQQCGYIWETFVRIDETVIKCVHCDGKSERLISASGVYTANQTTSWLPSVLEVVEKNSGKAHCEEFLKDPTRKNYKRWMKSEGLRHLEPGEKAEKSDETAIHKTITKEVYEKHRQRHALEI